MIPWATITSLGDMTVTAPAAAAIMAGFALTRAWRLALLWAMLFIGGLALVAATKIAFIGWGIGIRSIDFAGFSGHSMRATAIAPVFCYLMLQKAPATARMLGVFLGIVIGVLIGISRIVLHAHSLSETVAGCILGGIVSLAFIWILSRSQQFELTRPLAAFCLIALVLLPYAEPAPTQRLIVDISLHLSGNDQPFVRDGWKFASPNWDYRNSESNF